MRCFCSLVSGSQMESKSNATCILHHAHCLFFTQFTAMLLCRVIYYVRRPADVFTTQMDIWCCVAFKLQPLPPVCCTFLADRTTTMSSHPEACARLRGFLFRQLRVFTYLGRSAESGRTSEWSLALMSPSLLLYEPRDCRSTLTGALGQFHNKPRC